MQLCVSIVYILSKGVNFSNEKVCLDTVYFFLFSAAGSWIESVGCISHSVL